MLNMLKKWFKHTNEASYKSYCELRDMVGFPCSSKEELRFARKNDVHGNYDIDGVSYDGNSLFVGSQFDTPK